GPEKRQLIERRGHEYGTGQALERGGGGDLYGGMVVAQQAEHPADVVRRRRHRQEARAFEPFPPAGRPVVGAHHACPPLRGQHPRQVLPPLAGHPGGPGDERVYGQRHGQTRQGLYHLGRGRLSHRPSLHHRVQRLAARLEPGAATHAEPAIQDDQNDQRDEQDSLRDGDDPEKLQARHRPPRPPPPPPPPPLILPRAPPRPIGFTRKSSAPPPRPRRPSPPGPGPPGETTPYPPRRSPSRAPRHAY